MKTMLASRTNTNRFRLPRTRLAAPRWRQRLRAPAMPPVRGNANTKPETLSAATESVPTESVHSDSLTLYLREIGQVKLLTPAEEIALAKRIKRGDKKAREQMITANLRLVVKIARDYQGLGLPLLDLINEGNIGSNGSIQSGLAPVRAGGRHAASIIS